MTHPRIPRLPARLDRQRHTEAAEACTDIGADDDADADQALFAAVAFVTLCAAAAVAYWLLVAASS